MTAGSTVVGVLLTAPDPDQVRPGVLGLVVVLALVAATALLLRSFVKQLGKVDFDEDPDPAGDPDRAGPDPAGGPDSAGGPDQAPGTHDADR